jgi:hypothetical protein
MARPAIGGSASNLTCNHTFAQRMFHHDLAIMLYAPFKMAIYVDRSEHDSLSTGPARGFGQAKIGAVGLEFGRDLAGLIEALGAPIHDELR